jgi:hypothetical protein
MDIKGLRNLNLIGTILFCIIGIALVSVQYYQLNQYMEARQNTMEFISGDSEIDNTRDSEYNLCIGLLIVWLMIILIFTALFSKNLDIDRNYCRIRWWDHSFDHFYNILRFI